MVDRLTSLPGRLPQIVAERSDMLATGLANPTGAAALRRRLLEKTDTQFTPQRNDVQFSSRLSDALQSVAEAQNDAAQITRNFELGRETDLAKVMVSQQVSSLGFQLTLNVRNKVLSAYKDIMNMPV